MYSIILHTLLTLRCKYLSKYIFVLKDGQKLNWGKYVECTSTNTLSSSYLSYYRIIINQYYFIQGLSNS